jgi:hypothetical protein
VPSAIGAGAAGMHRVSLGGWRPHSEDAATFGSRYQAEAKRADRDGEHASEAGTERPTEHVCGHFKHRGRIGGRRQRAILFMVKWEFRDFSVIGAPQTS